MSLANDGYRVRISKGDKTFIITFDQLAQELGICDLTRRIKVLEAPLREQEIYDLLEDGPHTKQWIANRLESRGTYSWIDLLNDLTALINQGRVISTMSGTHHLYSRVEEAPE